MKFLMIDGAFMRNKMFNATQKLIISYINNLSRSGKCFYGRIDYLADQLGLDERTVAKNMQPLFKEGILKQTGAGVTMGATFEYVINFSVGDLHEFKPRISENGSASVSEVSNE